MPYDLVIAGGGPSGFSAALALGRARKRVLLCDSGPRRNARAERIQNFVTRDGTPPDEFRRIAREQLAAYPSVEVRDEPVVAIAGERGAFRVEVGSGAVDARRVLLCTGLIDELPELEGFRELWGRSIFQCPYCHGWEARDRPWGYLARPANLGHLVPFALQMQGWTSEVVVFTNGSFELPVDARAQLERGGIAVHTAPVKRLIGGAHALEAIELESGARVRCEALFAHPPQRQVELVRALGVELDEEGFVRVDPMRGETSMPGVFAAGDLTSRMQGAVIGAAAGMRAAAMINVELAMEGGPGGG